MTDAERWPSSSVSPENKRAVRGARERSRELRHPRAADQEKHGDLVVEAMILSAVGRCGCVPERGVSAQASVLRLRRLGKADQAIVCRSAYVAHEESSGWTPRIRCMAVTRKLVGSSLHNHTQSILSTGIVVIDFSVWSPSVNRSQHLSQPVVLLCTATSPPAE
jgi:hypothetical protein